MASDDLYESCLAILRDPALDDDVVKADKIEDLVRAETSLAGKALDNAVLDVLWRYRNNQSSSTASPLARQTVARRHSPAPWPRARTASPNSRTASPAPLAARPALLRMRSSQQQQQQQYNHQQSSPLASPRPSPRLAPASAFNPKSPSFELRSTSARASSLEPSSSEKGSDDGHTWVPGTDFEPTSSSTGSHVDAAADAAGHYSTMTPYDILRTIFHDQMADDEIEALLQANDYNLGAVLVSMTARAKSGAAAAAASPPDPDKTFVVGTSMSTSSSSRPVTPAGLAKSNVPCRYWLGSGQCLRADCRFSHDVSTQICRFWVAGRCIAGNQCMYSHDPAAALAGMALYDTPYPNQPLPLDSSADPAGPEASSAESESQLQAAFPMKPPSSFSSSPALAPEFVPQRLKAASQQSQPQPSPRPQPPTLNSDSVEDFPTLGAAAMKQSKRHHGKRGHGHANKDRDLHPTSSSSSLADVVRKSPAVATQQPQQQPQPPQQSSANSSPRQRPANKSRQSGKEAAIPAPEHIPWLETGDAANKAYINTRKEAIRHGGLRNKLLQSAAQAWNRNDVRAAKALSLRGQSENELMREAHREAARHLFDERSRHPGSGSSEVYADLHGLHPAEAVAYLGNALDAQKTTSGGTSSVQAGASSTFLYAIVGTGHHSKGGRDKVGKAVRAFLHDGGYAYREFSVPGDRGGSGGILGINVTTGTRLASGDSAPAAAASAAAAAAAAAPP